MLKIWKFEYLGNKLDKLDSSSIEIVENRSNKSKGRILKIVEIKASRWKIKVICYKIYLIPEA